jgi:hypothetical protein
VIVPSEHLVVVRMGISLNYGTGTEDMIAAIIAALHHQSQDRAVVAAPTR